MTDWEAFYEWDHQHWATFASSPTQGRWEAWQEAKRQAELARLRDKPLVEVEE